MSKIVEVRQIANADARTLKADSVGKEVGFGEFTMFPESTRSYVPMKNINGAYITGLDDVEPKELERLQKVLGKDLSPYSEFWSTFRIWFAMPEGFKQWNLEDPREYIEYKAALANKFVAPDRETLKESDDFYKRDVIFYVYDEQLTEKKTSALNELKDEISHILYEIRNNKDKLLLLVGGLENTFVSSKMEASQFYNILSTKRDKFTKIAELEKFRDYLKTKNEVLQANFYVKEAMKLNIITFREDIGQYKFNVDDSAVGNSIDKAKEFFAKDKNASKLAELINTVLEKRQ